MNVYAGYCAELRVGFEQEARRALRVLDAAVTARRAEIPLSAYVAPLVDALIAIEVWQAVEQFEAALAVFPLADVQATRADWLAGRIDDISAQLAEHDLDAQAPEILPRITETIDDYTQRRTARLRVA